MEHRIHQFTAARILERTRDSQGNRIYHTLETVTKSGEIKVYLRVSKSENPRFKKVRQGSRLDVQPNAPVRAKHHNFYSLNEATAILLFDELTQRPFTLKLNNLIKLNGTRIK